MLILFFGALEHLDAIQSVRIVNYGNICILHMCYFNYIESQTGCFVFFHFIRHMREQERVCCVSFYAHQSCNITELVYLNGANVYTNWRPLAAITNSLISNSTFSHIALYFD